MVKLSCRNSGGYWSVEMGNIVLGRWVSDRLFEDYVKELLDVLLLLGGSDIGTRERSLQMLEFGDCIREFTL